MPDALAIYGAAIGSTAAVGALWNVYRTMRDRPRLKLLEFWIQTAMGIPRVGITLANVGQRPTTLTSFAFGSPPEGSLELTRIEFPQGEEWLGPIPVLTYQKRLNEGERCTFVADLHDSIASGRFRIEALRCLNVRDATGKTWRFRLSSRDRQELGRVLRIVFEEREARQRQT
jgi:hypothetical protein